MTRRKTRQMSACFHVCFLKIPWLLLKKSCQWNQWWWRWRWCWRGWWRWFCREIIKTSFMYVILSDSLIYMLIKKCILKCVLFLFLTGLFDLLGFYWKILKNWLIMLSLKTTCWCYESSHVSKAIHFKVLVLT